MKLGFVIITFAMMVLPFVFAERHIIGMDSLGLGFDIIKGKPKLPTIQWSYKDATKWYNPFINEMQDVPNEAVVVVESSAELSADIFFSIEEYAASIASWHEIENAPNNAFTSSAQIQAASTLFIGEYAVGIVANTFQLYTIALLPSEQLKLSKSFSTMVESLSETYDAPSYTRILDLFGSHFVVEVFLGGEAVIYTQLEAELTAAGELHGAFSKILNQFQNITAQGGLFASSNLFTYSSVKGGLVEKWGNYNNWVESIKDVPSPIGYRLADISELVSHPKKKQNMKLAINDRFQKMILKV